MKEKNRKIIFEDGQEFEGIGFGAAVDRVCEIVFNTSMAGYQEILSDPSYTDQAVVMTYPLIGNYGMAKEDYETETPTIGALIVREYNDLPSNFRSVETLDAVMKRYDIPGIQGIDTRMLTRSIRDYGSRKVLITDIGTSAADGTKILRNTELPHDAVSRVSCRDIWFCAANGEKIKILSDPESGEKMIRLSDAMSGKMITMLSDVMSRDKKNGLTDILSCEKTMPLSETTNNEKAGRLVVAIDCGMKENIVRSFNRRGVHVIRVPWNTSAEVIRSLNPDGIFISNGPGDPTDVPEAIRTIKELIGYRPIFGICLGHQIISLAYGAKTYKLKFGHRGGNHPVRDLETGRIEITSQNHSYAVDEESLSCTFQNLLPETNQGTYSGTHSGTHQETHPETHLGAHPGTHPGSGLTVTHINLLDHTVEGVKCERDRVFSVQYHPESAPGPQDSGYLFDRFLEMLD